MAGKNRKVLVDEAGEKYIWRVTEDEIPETPKDGVLIKVMHAGICHSDVHMAQKGLVPNFILPRVFGHEISGVVKEIGEELLKEKPDFQKDDRVIVFPWGYCTKCPSCSHGLAYCDNALLPTGTGPQSGFVYGVWKDGGFQNYVVVHRASFILKVPTGFPMDVAALVPCSGMTSLNACNNLDETIERAIKVYGSARVAVVGAGGLALWCIQILKAKYPDKLKVVAIDIVDDKLQDAKAQGADEIFKWGPKDEVPDVVSSFLKEIKGFIDGVIDFTGIPDCQMRSYALLNPGGTLVMIGLSMTTVPPYPITPTILKNITIKGVVTGTRDHCREMFALIQANKVRPPPITAVKLDEVEKIINLMKENKIRGRNVVSFN